jgi:hypothetical protein
MLDACLVEISRRTPQEGILFKRAYACRTHVAEVAKELVRDLTSWTSWSDPDEQRTEDAATAAADTATAEAEAGAGEDGGGTERAAAGSS